MQYINLVCHEHQKYEKDKTKYRAASSSLQVTVSRSEGKHKEVQKLFGFTTENVQSKALELLEFYKAREAPCLFERPDAP